MTTLKEYVKQYTDEKLCKEWNNNIPLSVFDASFDLCLDSQDLDYLCNLEFAFLPRHNITGYVVKIGDGDYLEVYVTEWSRPFDLVAIYHPLEYYLD